MRPAGGATARACGRAADAAHMGSGPPAAPVRGAAGARTLRCVPTALVPGANRGIGLEVARQLAARGFDVLASARDPARVPAGLNAVRLDVTDQGTIAALRREVGELEVVVNNAAI